MADAWLALADYRRRVSKMYAAARECTDARLAWQTWKQSRDQLFSDHGQSALSEADRAGFRGLPYFPYDRSLRFEAHVEHAGDGPDPGPALVVELKEDGTARIEPVGTVSFRVGDTQCGLTVYRFASYGGGLFLPFGDLTNGHATYGGGRYLLDTVKGADLGSDGDRLILDFNFAYNPSCAYNPRWHCPLPPPENRLPVELLAGELAFRASSG